MPQHHHFAIVRRESQKRAFHQFTALAARHLICSSLPPSIALMKLAITFSVTQNDSTTPSNGITHDGVIWFEFFFFPVLVLACLAVASRVGRSLVLVLVLDVAAEFQWNG